MSDQELLFRMFICEFMGWYTSELFIIQFDLEHTLANRILPLFPREIYE
jgi:hypothetical protein